ncbi:serine-threonine dehydratase [Trypanosoma theileri]|uniref:Serine-threonine dehydratase n=1 Tax=Trypanosoma theileri TaxID=67003 RepID=A0A1X0NKY6_9TRYP|nr:serine-threonine dehydratase [Trypanosoma theileri]ORC85297.1 serine-threonine dehydratase [Trypanosoma theileri]
MPTFHDVMTAHKAIRNYVHETPILTSNALRQKSDHEEIVLKCENLQRTGAYNLRGAVNHVIHSKQMDLGINHFVARSLGNHGIAVALAANAFDATGHIVIPPNPSDIVVKSIRHYGGRMYPCGPSADEQMQLVQRMMDSTTAGGGVREKGEEASSCVYVHPQDKWVAAGHGTAGVELMLQTDCRLDAVVVPAAGAALLAGVGLAVKGMKPNIAVYGALNTDDEENQEMKKNDSKAHNKNGKNNNNKRNGSEFKLPPVISDHTSGASLPSELLGTMTPEVAECVERNVDGIICVNAAATRYAFRFVYERCKLVIDAEAATAIAAVLQRPKELTRYRHIGIILSGGNVILDDIPKLSRL